MSLPVGDPANESRLWYKPRVRSEEPINVCPYFATLSAAKSSKESAARVGAPAAQETRGASGRGRDEPLADYDICAKRRSICALNLNTRTNVCL